MREIKKPKSIGKYIAAGLIGIALVPVIIMIISSFMINNNLVKNRVHIDQESATSVVMKIQSNLEKKSISQLERIGSQSEFNQKTFDLSNIQKFLNNIKADGDPDISNLGFATIDGKAVMTESVPSGYDARERPWFKGAMEKNGQAFVTPAYRDVLTGNMITTYAKIITNSNGDKGILFVDFPYGALDDVNNSLKVGKTGSSTLITTKGVVLTSNSQKKALQYKAGDSIADSDVYKKVAADSRSRGYVMVGHGMRKHEVYFNKGQANSTAWAISEVAVSERSEETRSLLVTSIIVLVLILTLAISVSFIFVKIIKKIIAYYEYYFGQVGQGNLMKIKVENLNTKNWLNRKLLNLGIPDPDGHELNRLGAQYDEMVIEIGDLIAKVQTNSQQVAQNSDDLLELAKQTDVATDEVANTITGIAEVTGNQARETENSVTQVQNLSAIVKELRTNIVTMTEQANASNELNKQSLKLNNNVSANWQSELQKMTELMHGMEDMNQNIQSINQIIKVINDISQQTNLLALNASIEAASAGDAGNGFAVVAAEIRKLAEESKASTKDIASIIEKIRSKSAAMVEQTETSVTGGKKQSELITQAINSSEEVFKKNTELVTGIQQIEAASAKIEQVQHEVLTNLESISASTEENSAGTEEVSANAEEVLATMDEFTSNVENLRNIAQQLNTASDQFTLDDNLTEK